MILILLLLILVWLAAWRLGGELWPSDLAILSALYAGDVPLLAGAMRIVTELGGWMVLVPLALAGALWFARRGDRERALWLLGITMGGRFLVELQKYATGRARPEQLEQLAPIFNLSFPSGHAANSAITYGALALFVVPPAWRRTALVAALLLTLAIGLSRMMLGVHWPSDVAGGWAFGLAWTLGWAQLAQAKGTLPGARH